MACRQYGRASQGLSTHIVEISVVLNVAPTVEAGADQTVDEGDLVLFTGTLTDPGLADTHAIEWDFGDGSTTSDTLDPSHVYSDEGVYTVTLTVTDDGGGVGVDTLTVTVNKVASATPVCVDDYVSLSYGYMCFDRRTGLMSMDVIVTNTSETPISGPI